MSRLSVGVLLLTLLLLSGCSLHKSTPQSSANAPTAASAAKTEVTSQSHDIAGSLLIEPGYHYDAEPCVGQGGFSDLHAGTQITVKNADGQIIAIGELQNGRIEVRPDAVYWGRCRLPLRISDVPDSPFYTFSIGNRPGATYTRAEMIDGAWGVQFSIGQPDW